MEMHDNKIKLHSRLWLTAQLKINALVIIYAVGIWFEAILMTFS